jgi:hypothetical protein
MLPDACLFLHSTRSAAKSKGILDAIVIHGCCTPYRLTKVKTQKELTNYTNNIWFIVSIHVSKDIVFPSFLPQLKRSKGRQLFGAVIFWCYHPHPAMRSRSPSVCLCPCDAPPPARA